MNALSLIFSHTSLKKDVLSVIERNNTLVLSGVNNPTAKSFVVHDIFKSLKKKCLWITVDEEELFEMKKDLELWNHSCVFSFPQEGTDKEILHILIQFQKSNTGILLLEKKQFDQKLPLFSALEEQSLSLSREQKWDIANLVHKLIDLGYEYSDETLLPIGTYRRLGDILEIFPLGYMQSIRIEVTFDIIESIKLFDALERKALKELEVCQIFPSRFPKQQRNIVESFPKELFVFDEIDEISSLSSESFSLKITSFPQDDEEYSHLRYLSVLKFYTLSDFLMDIRNKLQDQWTIAIYTKRHEEIEAIFKDEQLHFSKDIQSESRLKILEAHEDEYIPASFQNPEEKILFLTDKEIFSIKKASRNQSAAKMNIDFITSLNTEDYIVHFDHGIGIFTGIVQKVFDGIKREYLEIEYAGNDKIYVPVDQADKISKYITEDNTEVSLSRLGGAEWQKQVKKAKKETEELARELLELYAKRAQAERQPFMIESDREKAFAETFPYTETPGQIAAIMDVSRDMESIKPMDRLVCGDVGFGKTEVALRAAFKAVESGKQVALISPVTILAEQHFENFKDRMGPFGIRVEMMSRFRTAQEQAIILEKLRKGELDIVVGTHRLLQEDIQFLSLGLLIIDEEQRFGVKQKEKLKNIRSQVDVLTLTATPIPRTLNLSLNKLRDITTITTPPPGRLPIITEVRKYSDQLIRDAILKELNRGGQIYFLHNRVETIEGIAEKLRIHIPEASFIVAHGQLSSKELEERIMAFKKGEYQVLVSSTIIENGIDLANANTMIINNAEQFGLSQLYQLRGRIGRSNKQAYAYLLYHGQKLKVDAKKRLRALIEASELGSGFQIAMRDLEIRGAGEILGSSQHGTMKSIGVGYFLKMLNKTITQMRNGTYIGDLPQSDVTIELPINAYIPNNYITDHKEKLLVYQKLASVEVRDMLMEFHQDVKDEYGKLPEEAENLFRVLKLKLAARKIGISKMTTKSVGYSGKEIQLILTPQCQPQKIVKALEKNPKWEIIGSTLKINIVQLGPNWIEGLLEILEYMAEDKPLLSLEK